MNQDKADRGQGPAGALTSDEKEELRRLRRENREQQQTIETLKKVSMGALRARTRRAMRMRLGGWCSHAPLGSLPCAGAWVPHGG